GPWDVTDWMQRRTDTDLEAAVSATRLAEGGMKPSPLKRDREALVAGADLPGPEKLMLYVIAHRAQWQTGPLPTVSELARDCGGVHRVTAQRTLTALRRRGVLAGESAHTSIRWDILAV